MVQTTQKRASISTFSSFTNSASFAPDTSLRRIESFTKICLTCCAAIIPHCTKPSLDSSTANSNAQSKINLLLQSMPTAWPWYVTTNIPSCRAMSFFKRSSVPSTSASANLSCMRTSVSVIEISVLYQRLLVLYGSSSNKISTHFDDVYRLVGTFSYKTQ